MSSEGNLTEFVCDKCGTKIIALTTATVTCPKGHSMRVSAILKEGLDKRHGA